MPLSPGASLAHYKIIAMIGKGGMGEVYQAFDTRLERDVAIKVLPQSLAQDPERLARFHREAKLLAALNHPNIATVHGLIEDHSQRALVMELVPGETLADIIKRGPIPPAETLKISRQIAEALEAAHEKNVIHRDLKPGNVMLTPSGLVKVLDFGLATVAHSSPTPSSDPTLTFATVAGTILGTAAYMSPEQAEGLPTDRRSDIWSYGVVVWEMCTGQRLFHAPSSSQTLADVLRKQIDFSELPPTALQPLLKRCLDRDVKNRLRDIGEARIAIDAANEPAPIAKSSTPYAWIAAAIFALAFAAIAFLHFRQSPPERQHVKFQITPPEGQLGEFKVSPDGKSLFTTTLIGVGRKIWIRSLASLDTRLATETRDRGAVFWSLDGENLIVPVDGNLYKFARAGGAPVLLTEAPPGYTGGVWLDDGVIVLTSSNGLFRLSASGGTPAKFSEQIARLPAWLPGGRFLFTGDSGIFAGSTSGANPTQLLPDLAAATYVPPSGTSSTGHLLFVRVGSLYTQAFDPGKLEFRGEAISVIPNVGVFSAASNGVLAIAPANTAESILTWLDRAGKPLGTVGKPFRLASNPLLQLSSNNNHALVPIAGTKGPDYWIVDFSRGAFSRQTFDESTSALWSPDGRKILWSARDGSRYLKAADGSGQEELLFKSPQPSGYLESWSNDGKLVAFAQIENRQLKIWLVPLDGDRKPFPYNKSRGAQFWPQFSPDSRWLAYTSVESGQSEIFIESVPSGKGRRQVSTEGGNWAIWNPNGTELFYNQGNKLIAVPIRLTQTAVESGKPQPIFDAAHETRFQVSRDGQRFLIAVPVDGFAATTQITIDTDWRAALPK